VHPPPGKPEGKNSTKIIVIKINKPGIIKFGSLVKEKSGPSFNIIIVTVRNIKITKNLGRNDLSNLFQKLLCQYKDCEKVFSEGQRFCNILA
jgi:hypothetical protein